MEETGGEGLNFRDMVDIEKWQKIQNHFSDVLGVTLRTVDKNGVCLTQPSGSTRLCDEIVRQKLKDNLQCHCCLPQTLEAATGDWQEGFVCSIIGLHTFYVPLNVGGDTVAFIMVGPVILGKSQDTQKFTEKAERLGVEPERFLDAIREIRSFSYYGIKSVIELIYDIGFYVCALGYQNKSIKDLTPATPRILERVHDFYIDRLLDALLEVSTNFTDAERGSVMLLDERSSELYIKIAKGLSEDILERIDKTRPKLGEGIAGIVVRDQKPLFIDDNTSDENIRSQFKNPQIKSAISVPIKVKDKVIGVLNLGTYKPDSSKLTSKSLNAIDRLAHLVGATLGDLPQAQSVF